MVPALFGLAGTEAGADERAFIREAEPAGFILFGRNIEDPAQLRALTDSLRDLTGRDRLPILVDQEGGRVARLGPPHWPAFPAAAAFGSAYRRAPVTAIAAARANAEAIGAILAEAGINVNCAPPLDLAHPQSRHAIGDRSFGADPAMVAALGRAMLDGLARSGVAGCIKHLPGLGRGAADSHVELPRIDASETELADDLAPFRALRDARFGMVAHAAFAAWDADRPASLSPAVIDEAVRRRIGFRGLLLSDDIAMGALEGAMEARAAAAHEAGCDLVLHCTGRMREMEAIAAALPAMEPASRERLADAIPAPGPTLPWRDALAKRDALLAALST